MIAINSGLEPNRKEMVYTFVSNQTINKVDLMQVYESTTKIENDTAKKSCL